MRAELSRERAAIWREIERVGLVPIAQGFSTVFHDDHEQLAAELPVDDPLYAWCPRAEGQT